VTWQLRFPHLDIDGLLYHLPLTASWMPDGDAGAATPLLEGLPVGNYPLTNEVALAWALGIADGMAWLSVWSPLMWTLAALAGWVGLRTLAVPRAVAALAIAAILTLPLTVVQLGAPLTDLPALAWAATTAALCLGALRRPSLLVPALVAAALAVGTKTTPAPLLVLALGITMWRTRAALRPLLVRALLPAVALGTLVGGAWMIRNTVSHGWPLWPFMSGPTGDELPVALRGFDKSFLEDPGAMLDGRTSDYGEVLSGGVVVLAGLLVLPLLAFVAGRGRGRGPDAGTRDAAAGAPVAVHDTVPGDVERESPSERDPGGAAGRLGGAAARLAQPGWRALAFAGAALFGVFSWANAPYTGIQEPTALAVGAVRYLLPALACAAVAIAVAGADGPRWVRRGAMGVLALAVVVSVGRVGELGFPYAPSAATLLLFGAIGAAVAAVAPTVLAFLSRPGVVVRAGGGVAVIAAAVSLFAVLLLGNQSQEYLIRHTAVQTIDAGILGAFIRDPVFRADEGRVVAMGPATLGSLAGERLQHELELIPADEACTRTRSRRRRGWVVAQVLPDTDTGRAIVGCMQGIPELFRDKRYVVWAGDPPR
jgi:hypothetical protein